MTDSLGRRLVRAVLDGATGAVEVEADGCRARADIGGAGPYGSELRGLTVWGPPRPPPDVARDLTDLPEPLAPFEVEPDHAVLRTPARQVREREYAEAVVCPGRVDVARWRGGTGGRERVPDAVGHRALQGLVDGVAEALRGPDGPTGSLPASSTGGVPEPGRRPAPPAD